MAAEFVAVEDGKDLAKICSYDQRNGCPQCVALNAFRYWRRKWQWKMAAIFRRWMPFRRGGEVLRVVAMEDGELKLSAMARRMPLCPGSGIDQVVAMEDGGDFLVDGCPFVVAAELFNSW
ncbi:MAG: hypothetical protein ACRCZI_10350 [Cetobacterium sp.]